jgi:hypothetical protein
VALRMSALGQKQTCAVQKGMSALPPIATSITFSACLLWAKSGHGCLLFLMDPAADNGADHATKDGGDPE